MVQQFIHGTQYIDELVMVRVANKGDLYVHQDANWNVIGLTDLGGHLVERYVYNPYGELTVEQATGFGDRNGDASVNSTDRDITGAPNPPTGSWRIMDLNFDGTVNSSDQTLFDSLAQGLQRNPGKLATAVSQPFAHQGLLFEPEIGSYQNRARQYDPGKRYFIQRDRLKIKNCAFRKRVAQTGLLMIGRSEFGDYRDGLNLYAIVQENPLNKRDPSNGTAVPCCLSRSRHGPSKACRSFWRGSCISG